MLSSIFAERQPNGQISQIWATDGQIHMTPYKEFISRQEKHFQPRHGHFIKADGRFIKANGHFIKPMAVLSRGATLEPG